MNLSPKENRQIALAALFQSAQAVADLGQQGHCDSLIETVLLDSLFVFDAPDTLAIYQGQLKNLAAGLDFLQNFSQHPEQQHFQQVARYAIGLLALEKKLGKNANMQQVIHSRLKHIAFNQTHFSENRQQLAAAVSGVYQDTLSTLKFRIQVQGKPEILQQTAISDRIRALLLSGIRAAMLWRQLGGSKWQLIVGRKAIETTSKQLLNHIHQD